MKVSVYTKFGANNSKKIFDAFITSLKNAGDEVQINEDNNSDVVVIWSVLWQVQLTEPPSSIGINANPPPATLELILSLNLTYITGDVAQPYVPATQLVLLNDRTPTSWTYLPFISLKNGKPMKRLPYVPSHIPLPTG